MLIRKHDKMCDGVIHEERMQIDGRSRTDAPSANATANSEIRNSSTEPVKSITANGRKPGRPQHSIGNSGFLLNEACLEQHSRARLENS